MSDKKVTPPTKHKKTPIVIKHETPTIIQLPKYNVFLSVKMNINHVEVGLDENGEVIMNKIPNSEGDYEPQYYGVNTKPVVTLMTKEEVRDHLGIYKHD